MQFIEGETLSERLKRRGRLPLDEALEIILQCLAGLKAAHARGLIHRDIKPGNILIDRETGRAMLVDFGLVRRMDQSERMTATGMVMGTVDYIAPEQARGHKVDGRADLYSLGVLTYQLLANRLPFEAETPTAMIFQHAYETPFPLAEAAPDVPQPVLDIIDRMMAKDADIRYANCDQVFADLAAFREDRPLAERPAPTGQRTTTIHSIPDSMGEVELPEQLDRLADNRWICHARDYAATMFRRHAPQFVKDLQDTTQQVDGAVAEYERRHHRLTALRDEARSVANELLEHLQSNVEAAAAAMQSVDSAETEEDEQAALAKKHECEEHVDALRTQYEAQQEQLEQIERDLGKADAMLARLHSQRDVLKARLKMVTAQQMIEGGRPRPKRTRRIVAAVLVGALLLPISIVAWNLMPGRSDHLSELPDHVSKLPEVQQPPAEVVQPLMIPPPDKKVLLIFNVGHEMEDAKAACELYGLNYDSVGRYDALKVDYSDYHTVFSGSNNMDYWGQTVERRASDAFGHLEEFVNDGGHLIVSASFNGANMQHLRRFGFTTGFAHSGFFRPIPEVTKLLLEGNEEFVPADNKLQSVGDLKCSVPHTTLLGRPVGGKAEKCDVMATVRHRKGRVTVSMVEPFHKNDYWLIRALMSWVSRGSPTSQAAVESGFVPVVRYLEGHTDRILHATTFSPDSSRAVSGSWDGTVRVWDIAAGSQLYKIDASDDFVRSVAYSPDGRYLLSGASDGQVRLWDAATGNLVRTFEGSTQDVYSVAFTPDGRHLLATGNSSVWYWETDSGRLVHHLTPHPKLVQCVATSPDGRLAASGSTDCKIAVWDLKTGICKFRFHQKGMVRKLAFTKDGGRILAVGNAGIILLWDIAMGRTVREYSQHDGELVWDVAFSPDGRFFVTTAGNELCIWDVESGEVVDRMEQNRNFLYADSSVAWSPDGKHILWGRTTGLLNLLEVKDGKLKRAAPVASKAIEPAASIELVPDNLVPGAPVDLLKLIDPSMSGATGNWHFQGETLISPGSNLAKMPIPYIPTEQYQLTVVAERKTGNAPLSLGLVAGNSQTIMVIDDVYNSSGLSLLRGVSFGSNGTRRMGVSLKPDRAATIVYTVTKGGVRVAFDGETIMDWRGDLSKLSVAPRCRIANPKWLYLMVEGSVFHITKLEYRPLLDAAPGETSRAIAIGDKLPTGQWVELLPHLDLALDTVSGKWVRDPKGLTIEQPERFQRIALPVKIRGDYDLEVEFTRMNSYDITALTFPVGDTSCALLLGCVSGAASGLELIDGKDAMNNATTRRPSGLWLHKKSKVLVTVRQEGDDVRIEISLGGQPYLEWSGKRASLAVAEDWKTSDPLHPGLGVLLSGTIYHSARLRVVSGEALLVHADDATINDAPEGQ